MDILVLQIIGNNNKINYKYQIHAFYFVLMLSEMSNNLKMCDSFFCSLWNMNV